MRRPLMGAALSALALTMTACGSSGSDSTSDAPAAGASGKPITVGYVNMEGGALSFPDVRIGAEAGVRYVNTELNGVNGRPLKLMRCDVDGTPEKSIDCANKFVEAKVAFVFQGIDPGVDAMLPILKSAGIPITGHSADAPGQQADANAMAFGTAAPASLSAPLKFYSQQGVRSYAFVLPEAPWGHAIADKVLKPASAALGMKPKVLFTDAANPDWSSLVATAMAGKPDMIGGPVLTDEQCAGFVGALKNAGYRGKVFGGTCTSAFAKAIGNEAAAGVVTFSDMWRADGAESAPAAKQKEIKVFEKGMKAAGKPDTLNVFAEAPFSDAVNLARILSTIKGEITGPAVLDALKKTKDFDLFLGPVVTCDGTAWPGQSNCGNSILFYENQPEGGVKVVSDGYLRLTPADLAPAK
ncbi:ABC transporter substrate-binding protein [Streptomyces sp. NPDC047085]|uniref:ABC transporter substrate-binding protein n=1 Tax=Streptomyces sp. NPDC047085 TaxID=3155140 RepID=UPI0033F503E0